MAKISKLTDSFLKSVKCENGKKYQKISDPAVKRLYVFIYPSGKKLFKIREKGDLYTTLAEYPLFSLGEIREMAFEALRLQSKGKNTKNAKILKFGALYDTILEKSREDGLALKTIQRGLSYKLGVFKPLEFKNINEIKRADIIEVLKSVESKSETLNKAKTWINKVFDYALQLELIENNPVASINNRIVFKKPTPTLHRPTLLNQSDIKKYLKDLIQADIKQSHKNLMLFTLLTAQRPGNIIKATWNEIDFKNKLWNIPAFKMKTRKAHSLPLNTQALEILKEQEKLKVNDFVFAGSSRKGCNSENIACNINKRLGYQGIQSAHGFRAMFKSLAEEQQLIHQISMDIAEQCLAHERKDAIIKAYTRGENLELKRKLMQWWGDYIKSLF